MIAFSFFSHKVLRWLGPFLILIAFCCTMALVNKVSFAVLAVLESAFFAVALLGYRRKRLGRSPGVARIPLHFCSMNLALLLGFGAYVTGQQSLVWNATPRQSQADLNIDSTCSRDTNLVQQPTADLHRAA
jgi:poly-beta-1,6-N-acetyl-D-glucosamine synthase